MNYFMPLRMAYYYLRKPALVAAVAALAFRAGAAFGAPPALVIPPEVKPAGQYAEMTPETDAASVVYVGLDELDPIPARLLSDKRTFLLDTFGKRAGRYRFAAVAASKDGEQVRKDFVLLIGDAPVPPGPTPPGPTPPGPGPTPTPPGPVAPQKLFVVVVEETADAVAARGTFFTDATLAARVKERGHRWRVVDKDVLGADGQPPADVKRFIDAARGKAYPQLSLVTERGATVHTGDMPKTPTDLIAVLQKFGG